MPAIFILAIIAWFIFGDPIKTITETFWSNDAAPWEGVDAFYYPDRNDLSVFEKVVGLGSVEECRQAVNLMAANRNDLGLTKGDYECAVGQLDNFGDLSVYRLTVR